MNRIPHNGNKLYFCINLPDIYSAHDYDPEDGSGSSGTNLKFEWVPNIGCQIIKKCTLGIGGNKISEIYGQWIEIFHEIFLLSVEIPKFNDQAGVSRDEVIAKLIRFDKRQLL